MTSKTEDKKTNSNIIKFNNFKKKNKKITSTIAAIIAVNIEHPEDVSPEDYLIDKIEGNKINSINISSLQKHIESDLDEKERIVIIRRKLKDKQDSLSTIGKAIGLSAERVRQIESSAIQKLKKRFSHVDEKAAFSDETTSLSQLHAHTFHPRVIQGLGPRS